MSTSTSTEAILAFPEAVALAPVNQSRTQVSKRSSDRTSNSAPSSISDIQQANPSKGESYLIIICVAVITGISTLLAGVITTAIPSISRDIGIPHNLLLWPASIFSLTCGCTLLVFGSVADVVGSSNMYLIGSALQSAFTLACGLSNSGSQLILFRGFAGIASSMCLPSAVSIITTAFVPGKRRNIAFAAMGGGQPLGFAIGLTLGGVFASTIGWRWAFHIAAILNTGILVLAVWGLPKSRAVVTWSRLRDEIDWVGALIASTSLALLCYVLAILTEETSKISEPAALATLITGIALIPAFVLWVRRQEKLGRPAVIPNSLWRNRVFTAICINVFITWGTFNAAEQLLTFVFQDVQHVSAIKASIYFLPAPVFGTLSNIVIGLIAHKVDANKPVLIGNLLAGISPLLLAFINENSTYWAFAFPGISLNAVGADVLFTIANLVIGASFPEKTQALAGGVFNTVSQIGKTVGLATSAVIASSATMNTGYKDKESPPALMEGYRAAFWYCFALCGVTIFVNFWGLRGIGKVGAKRD